MMNTKLSYQIFDHHNPQAAWYSHDFQDHIIHHPIRHMVADNFSFIYSLFLNGRLRSGILDSIMKMLLCRTYFLGYDLFECPVCHDQKRVPRCCHSRFCNTCGVKYSRMIAANASAICLDVRHRHLVFTIPDCLRSWFLQDRSRLNLLFVAARNTMHVMVSSNLYKKLKKSGRVDSFYKFKNFPSIKQFGMIAALHTFGRDLKWNPHIHALVPELIYDPKKDQIKAFTHFRFEKLRKTFQFELLRLIGLECQKNGTYTQFLNTKNQLYSRYDNGFYVYARLQKALKDDTYSSKVSEDINACIQYMLRYVGRPAMAESRIVEYDRQANCVHWFYHDHKTELRHDEWESSESFIVKLIRHIPDPNFKTIRYYGFYSNASRRTLDHVHDLLGKKNKKDYSRKKRKEKRNRNMEKLTYRNSMIDCFNKDPIKCRCGTTMEYRRTFDPVPKGEKNVRRYLDRSVNEVLSLRVPRDRSKVDLRRNVRDKPAEQLRLHLSAV